MHTEGNGVMNVDQNFKNFAKSLVPSQKYIDPETLRRAKAWYNDFAGQHAVKMTDVELVEIYTELH